MAVNVVVGAIKVVVTGATNAVVVAGVGAIRLLVVGATNVVLVVGAT